MTRIEWTLKAMKQAKRIASADRPAIIAAVETLADWPRCRNVKALQGQEGYRLRVGRYRVIFTLHEGDVRIVRIEEVKKRDERTYN